MAVHDVVSAPSLDDVVSVCVSLDAVQSTAVTLKK